MLKEQNLFKLIIFIPILFIVLTASFITYMNIQNAEDKFRSDSYKLTNTFLEEEKSKVHTVLEALNSFVVYKKSTAINILKNRVKTRHNIADEMLMKMYNNLVGIESKSSIEIDILSSLSKMEILNEGKYFIYSKNNSLNTLDKKKDDLINKINLLLKEKNEGFIFFNETVNINGKEKTISKICYIKKFEFSDFVLGYCEEVSSHMEIIKDEVLSGINLMKFNGDIYILDNNLTIIQHTTRKNKIGKNLADIEENKNILYLTKEYLNYSKNDSEAIDHKHYWEKIDDNNYKLVMFYFVKDWNWIINTKVNVFNINKNINELIGIKQNQKDETIKEALKTALIFICIASIISYFVTYYIYLIFEKYREKIENQKSVLKQLNSSLEKKVAEKTKLLEEYNLELIEKFKEEVQKNKEKDILLSEQSKHASMGEMIGHIAHQWRQPLSTISIVASGNYLKIEHDMMEKNEIKKDLTMIVDLTSYLSTTIDDFRNFFVEDKIVSKFDVSEIIEKDLNLIKSVLIKNNITVIKNFNFVEIYSIKNEFIQAILNILNNAKDILIQQENKDKFIVIDVYKDENNSIIKIQDSGGGISDDIINRVFEQYFTTKDKAHGTGIGLYMTKQIIENNLNGKIEVSNQEFVHDEKIYFGACFIITLPINF